MIIFCFASWCGMAGLCFYFWYPIIMGEMNLVVLGTVSTVWSSLQCSAREKSAKVHSEEVGRETAYPRACPACPGPAGLQVRPCISSTCHRRDHHFIHSSNCGDSQSQQYEWRQTMLWVRLWLISIYGSLGNDRYFLPSPRYPSTLELFSRSHLPGPWDSSRAGQRMKLQRPETWERELSLRGNKACVWEELIGRWPWPPCSFQAFPIHFSVL